MHTGASQIKNTTLEKSVIINSMKVKIKLFASLMQFGPSEQEVDLPYNATIEDAVNLLKLPEKFPLLKIVNGEHRTAKHLLKDGDELALFPPVAGG